MIVYRVRNWNLLVCIYFPEPLKVYWWYFVQLLPFSWLYPVYAQCGSVQAGDEIRVYLFVGMRVYYEWIVTVYGKLHYTQNTTQRPHGLLWKMWTQNNVSALCSGGYNTLPQNTCTSLGRKINGKLLTHKQLWNWFAHRSLCWLHTQLFWRFPQCKEQSGDVIPTRVIKMRL